MNKENSFNEYTLRLKWIISKSGDGQADLTEGLGDSMVHKLTKLDGSFPVALAPWRWNFANWKVSSVEANWWVVHKEDEKCWEEEWGRKQ